MRSPGAFSASSRRSERSDDATFAAALEEGIRCAAEAIVDFGTGGLGGTLAV